MLKARGYPAKPFLTDLSAIVTACLLALSLPSLAPWWLIVTGTLFAIVVAKHLYGGLGQNIFNPAMVGYAVLIVSFPVQMTQWAAPLELTSAHLTLAQSAAVIFGSDVPKATLDAVTMATPLDALRTGLLQQHTVDEIMVQPIFGHYGGTGFEWLAGAFLLGGLVLWALRIISWHVPLAFLAGIWLTAGFLHFYDAGRFGAPWFHLFAPSVMLGAFFIATDPVSGATTPRGKLIFGLGAGFLTIVIRTWGGYPDGVAFAILLMNLCAPLMDQYTQPRVYGEARKSKEPQA
jgi:electron transport complex protein RnfD